jgi:hypothetical protein
MAAPVERAPEVASTLTVAVAADVVAPPTGYQADTSTRIAATAALLIFLGAAFLAKVQFWSIKSNAETAYSS